MASGPTTTGRALLGLLALRPWTAYELTQQMQRALRWVWPRSEASIYSELKRLAAQGLANAVDEPAGNRTRTRYEITKAGREELAAWLRASPTSVPAVEAEIVLRLFLADQADLDDLRRAIAATRAEIAARMVDAVPILEEYAGDDAPFPARSHLNVLFVHFMAGFFRHVLAWCDDVEQEVSIWRGTVGVGMTPRTRQMLQEALGFYRATIDRHLEPARDA